MLWTATTKIGSTKGKSVFICFPQDKEQLARTEGHLKCSAWSTLCQPWTVHFLVTRLRCILPLVPNSLLICFFPTAHSIRTTLALTCLQSLPLFSSTSEAVVIAAFLRRKKCPRRRRHPKTSRSHTFQFQRHVWREALTARHESWRQNWRRRGAFRRWGHGIQRNIRRVLLT